MYCFTVTGYWSERDFEISHPENWEQMTETEQEDWEADTFNDAASGCDW